MSVCVFMCGLVLSSNWINVLYLVKLLSMEGLVRQATLTHLGHPVNGYSITTSVDIEGYKQSHFFIYDISKIGSSRVRN